MTIPNLVAFKGNLVCDHVLIPAHSVDDPNGTKRPIASEGAGGTAFSSGVPPQDPKKLKTVASEMGKGTTPADRILQGYGRSSGPVTSGSSASRRTSSQPVTTKRKNAIQDGKVNDDMQSFPPTTDEAYQKTMQDFKTT